MTAASEQPTKQSTKKTSQGGHSSAGRAPALHAGGRRFDPAWLHQLHAVANRGRTAINFASFDTTKSFRLIAVRPQLILLFNNLEISDVLSGSTLIQDFLVELIQSSVAFAHVA